MKEEIFYREQQMTNRDKYENFTDNGSSAFIRIEEDSLKSQSKKALEQISMNFYRLEILFLRLTKCGRHSCNNKKIFRISK